MQQYQQAIADYDQAIRRDPNYLAAYNNRGTAYAGLEQYKAATADFDHAIDLDHNYAMAHTNKGLVYQSLQQLDKAIQLHDIAISLDSSLGLAYNNRGIAYIFSGATPRGCKDLTKACSLGNCKGHDLAKEQGLCK